MKLGFSDRLKAARAKAGMSQYELAARTGVSRDVIAQCEAGKIMRPKGLEDIAKALNVSPAWLAFGDDRIDKLSEAAIELACAYESLDDEDKAALKRMIEALQK